MGCAGAASHGPPGAVPAAAAAGASACELEAPPPPPPPPKTCTGTFSIAADDSYALYLNGVYQENVKSSGRGGAAHCVARGGSAVLEFGGATYGAS